MSNVVFGFGQGEVVAAHDIIKECQKAIEADPEDPKATIKIIQQKYADKAEEYKKLERDQAPERYTYFFFSHYNIYEGKHIIEFTMHHINRWHPMSSDGWGLWVTDWILSICPTEGTKIYRQA